MSPWAIWTTFGVLVHLVTAADSNGLSNLRLNRRSGLFVPEQLSRARACSFVPDPAFTLHLENAALLGSRNSTALFFAAAGKRSAPFGRSASLQSGRALRSPHGPDGLPFAAEGLHLRGVALQRRGLGQGRTKELRDRQPLSLTLSQPRKALSGVSRAQTAVCDLLSAP